MRLKKKAYIAFTSNRAQVHVDAREVTFERAFGSHCTWFLPSTDLGQAGFTRRVDGVNIYDEDGVLYGYAPLTVPMEIVSWEIVHLNGLYH